MGGGEREKRELSWTCVDVQPLSTSQITHVEEVLCMLVAQTKKHSRRE